MFQNDLGLKKRCRREGGKLLVGGLMGKVIDIRERLKSHSFESVAQIDQVDEHSLLDMNERRQALLNKERRITKRTILNGFVGAHIVIPERGLLKVAIENISPNGIAFDLETEAGQFKIGEEIAMRLYFNHETYFPFTVIVNRFEVIEEAGIIRHGVKFTDVNVEAIRHFVNFLESAAVFVRTDKGDILVSGMGG